MGAGGGASPPVGGAAGAPESDGGGGMSDGGTGVWLLSPGGGIFVMQPNAKNKRAATARMAANVANLISIPP